MLRKQLGWGAVGCAQASTLSCMQLSNKAACACSWQLAARTAAARADIAARVAVA